MRGPRLPVGVMVAVVWASSSLAAQSHPFSSDSYWDLRRIESPEISPDGKQIAYTLWTPVRDGNRWEPAIWQMDANGAKAAVLVPGSSPHWSPDGTRLAYLADIDGHRQLMLRTLRTGAVRQLTQDSLPPDEFRWSPDGSMLAYARRVPGSVPPATPFLARPGAASAGEPVAWSGLRQTADHPAGSRRQLFVVGADSGAPRQLTSGAMQVGALDTGAPSTSFSWFPDGKHIAFDGSDAPDLERSYLVSAIWFVAVETGGVGRLTSAPGFWHSPEVSPDGRWVAYAGFPESDESYRPEELWLMRPDGGGARSLTAALQHDPVGVIWAPDNQSLWFSAEDRGTVNVFNVTVANPSVVKAASNGMHALTLGALTARDGGFGVALRSSLLGAPELVRFALKKPADLKSITTVHQAAMASFSFGETEELAFGSGGLSLRAQLFRPVGFDPSRRYPLLVDIHDGPWGAFAAAFDPAVHFFAAEGYLVLRVNPRGSTGFAADLWSASSAGFPRETAADILAGVEAAIATGAVDTTAMMLNGCGAGAVVALQLLTTVQRFARASLECTGGDWLAQSGAAPVRGPDDLFFRRPLREDPLVWAERSPVRYASSIVTPILTLGGACDLAAPFGIGRPLHTALVLRRIESVLLEFPDECRGTTSRPANWVRTMQARLAWYRAPARRD